MKTTLWTWQVQGFGLNWGSIEVNISKESGCRRLMGTATSTSTPENAQPEYSSNQDPSSDSGF